MRRHLLLAAALLLAACAPSSKVDGARQATAAADAVMMEAVAAAPEAAPADGGGNAGALAQGSIPQGAPMLAYVYGVGIEAPLRAVRPLMAGHEAACRTAGPSVCQVISSNVSEEGDGERLYATMEMRAEPQWLERFRAGLEGEAKAAGGKIKDQSRTSEDLTRQIVDTEARLAAQKTLRERLKQILASRPGKLAELLETERELARVQGEIDSAESILAVMRQRVQMSILNLNYRSAPSAVSGGAFEPIGDAINRFLSIVATGFAAIITIVAFALPFALVLVPIGWFLWRRRKASRAAKKAVQA